MVTAPREAWARLSSSSGASRWLPLPPPTFPGRRNRRLRGAGAPLKLREEKNKQVTGREGKGVARADAEEQRRGRRRGKRKRRLERMRLRPETLGETEPQRSTLTGGERGRPRGNKAREGERESQKGAERQAEGASERASHRAQGRRWRQGCKDRGGQERDRRAG